MSLLADLVYSFSLWPHYCWHRFVTGRYGINTREKTGQIPERQNSKAFYSPKLGRESCRIADSRETPAPSGKVPCLWVHAVSVGETVAARGLINQFMAANPHWDFRITTTTATGRKVAIDSFGKDRVCYFPLDFSWMVKRSFDRIRPDMIVLMEQEIWPNFLSEAKTRQIPVLVANARVTARAAGRLKKFSFFTRKMLNQVYRWFPQNEDYANRLKELGVAEEKIEILGSVKYDAIPENLDESAAGRYRKLFLPEKRVKNLKKPQKLLVAGSTHPGEEEMLLKVWKSIREKTGADLYLLLVPRHPERLQEVESLAKTFGKVIRRSQITAGAEERERAEIILGDSMGELGMFYYAADVTFVGGTINKHGGQNFMEPCGLAKATVVGPNLWNFSEPAELLKNHEALLLANGQDELEKNFLLLLFDPDYAEAVGRKARNALLSRRGATQKTVDKLNDLAKTIKY